MIDPKAVADPSAPNGKMLAIDPEGSSDQRPVTISSGWNNPFAFAFAPDGTLYVADNVGGDGEERLAIGNDGSAPVVVGTFPAHSVPSGLAVLPDGRLVVCTYLARTRRTYRVDSGVAAPDVVELATDFSIGVVALEDGTIVYANEGAIRVIDR
jgi:DNA-binding beta-propeller fold protein YncE